MRDDPWATRDDPWATRFETHRPHLHAVAYRMLGSSSEADDAVQEAWTRFRRTETDDVENLGGWLTTVTGRVCLNMLRSRRTRREAPYDAHVPDPVIQPAEGSDPEHQAILADSVGLALLVVLDKLRPAERLAFVLHDIFAVSFAEIADLLDRSPAAARQLASRARRQVRGSAVPDVDLARQREVVNAFFTAARDGDLEALVSVLDPDAVLRSDGGPSRPQATASVRGGRDIARRAIAFALPEAQLVPARVNGGAGVVVTVRDRPVAVMGFTVVRDRVVAIEALADPDRLEKLDLSMLGG